MKTYIGVDLGGTNVRVAKVDEEGNILQIVKEPTEVAQGTEHVINKIISMIEKIDGYADCEGIGMGVPGPVNTIEGNSGDKVARRSYSIGSSNIYGYGVPAY